MADWDVKLPSSLLSRLQGLLEGDKPDPLKADEYGRAYFKSETPSETTARIKEEEA